MGLVKSCNTKKTIETVADLGKDSTWYWKDAYNKEHARAESKVAEAIFLRNDLKHLSNELKIKEKQIRSFKKANTTTEGTVVIKSDTFYKDNYVYIDRKGDTIFFSIKDTFQIVDYWKRTWFLGKKKYYVDISSSNPYTKVNSIVAREIKIKNPKILIGPSIQYNPFNNRTTPGVSIMYYPLTLKF